MYKSHETWLGNLNKRNRFQSTVRTRLRVCVCVMPCWSFKAFHIAHSIIVISHQQSGGTQRHFPSCRRESWASLQHIRHSSACTLRFVNFKHVRYTSLFIIAPRHEKGTIEIEMKAKNIRSTGDSLLPSVTMMMTWFSSEINYEGFAGAHTRDLRKFLVVCRGRSAKFPHRQDARGGCGDEKVLIIIKVHFFVLFRVFSLHRTFQMPWRPAAISTSMREQE